MALINTSLEFEDINFSVQVGDAIYYSNVGGMFGVTTIGGFNYANLHNTYFLGEVKIISNSINPPNWTVILEYDNLYTRLPVAGDYISFSKDKRTNTSGLKGYYAEVKLVNNSRSKIELFSLGSEIFESSK